MLKTTRPSFNIEASPRDADIAARRTDCGDAAHLPRAIDIDRHLEGRVITNLWQDRNGDVAESSVLHAGDVWVEGRVRVGCKHAALIRDERRRR